MKTSLHLLSLFVLVPTISFAQLVDFGAHSQAAEPTGFTLLEITPDTPAEALNLQPGDIVTQLDGRTVRPTASLAQLIAGFYSKGDEIVVKWTRDGKPFSGKTTLNREITDSAFNNRYSASTINPTTDAAKEASKQARALLDELQKDNPSAPAMANLLKLSIESNGTGVVMQSNTKTPDGDNISVTSSGGEEKNVKITDQAGELIYQGSITKENLDEIPEKYREAVAKQFTNSTRIFITPSTSLGAPSTNDAPEDDINDLLKNLESKEGE